MKSICLLLFIILFFGFLSADENSDKPLMQIAILLDTSNSMDGLIDQAKTQLWGIVNELGQGDNHYKFSGFQIAVYEYGNSSLQSDSGYIRKVIPFTNDVDRVSEALFSLVTNGGDEYCGWAIRSCVSELLWSNLYSDYKSIFIAGNEPFDQGNVDFRESCLEAFRNGIIVNTIHCGDYSQGVNTFWQEGAISTTGNYMVIDQDYKINTVSTPQDQEIEDWNDRLNATYIPYGKNGTLGKKRQIQEDKNAKLSSVNGYMQRVEFKSSRFYQSSSWDLVDAVDVQKIAINEAVKKDLPSYLNSMEVETLQKHLENKRQERKEICGHIQILQKQRREYLDSQSQGSKKDTLKAAMTKALRKQLKK